MSDAYTLGEKLGHTGADLQKFVNDLFAAERQRRADEREEAQFQREEAKAQREEAKAQREFRAKELE